MTHARIFLTIFTQKASYDGNTVGIMAKMHETTLKFYKARGYRTLLERCIKNEVFLEPFELNFNVNRFTSLFVSNPDSFPDCHKKIMEEHRTKESNDSMRRMTEEKEKRMLEVGIHAKDIFKLKQSLKSSCSDDTYKKAIFFLSGIFGHFASTIDKDMNRMYDAAASHKSMDKNVNGCWENQFKLMMSDDEFNRFDVQFVNDLLADDFMNLENEPDKEYGHGSSSFLDPGSLSNSLRGSSSSYQFSNSNHSLNARPSSSNLLETTPNSTVTSILQKTIMNDDVQTLDAKDGDCLKSIKNVVQTLKDGHIKKNGIVYNKARLNAIPGEENVMPENELVPTLKRKHE